MFGCVFVCLLNYSLTKVRNWLTVNSRADILSEWFEGIVRYRDEYDYEDVLSLTTRVLEGTHHRQRELESETTLSPQEAAVIALKEQGLTHKGVVLTMGLGQGQPGVADGDRLSPSTIDEYARRAREKYHKARRTADELDSVFS